jgi:hypothetical protein
MILFQKESLNFALYSSGWTESSIKCKKILLLAMRLNNAEKLKLQITKKQIVNFELFTSVRIIFFNNVSHTQGGSQG